MDNKEELIKTFSDNNPLLVEISEKFKEYDNRAEEIRQLPDDHNIGPVQIHMSNLTIILVNIYN